jgi:hypothetical protein
VDWIDALIDCLIGRHTRVYFDALKLCDSVSSVSAANSEQGKAKRREMKRLRDKRAFATA